MPVRGVRGAVVAKADEPEMILEATRELLEEVSRVNPELQPEDLASILFTVTSDLSSAYPARAARLLGWSQVPLMCAQEIPVQGDLERCIRVLIHWNTNLPQSAIQHVYLGETVRLRPDLVSTDK
jgi:chorismate mutase